MKKLLLSLAMAVGMVSVAGAVEVTDVLNQALVGNSGTSYSEYTVASSKTESGAAYALQCAGDKSSIQLRSKNNNSGVVSTSSGGTLKKVVVTWNSGTVAARVLNIYAADEAFTIAGLYGTSAPTPVATMTCSEATDGVSTYTFETDYKYIAFRSADGAMYLTSIDITWETGQAAAAVDKPIITADGTTVTIEAGATGADAIYYTINGNNPCRLPSIIQREHGFRQGIKGNIRVMFRKNSRPMIFICRKCSCFFSIRRSTIQILGYDIIGKGSSTDCNAGVNSRINRLNTKRKADHC